MTKAERFTNWWSVFWLGCLVGLGLKSVVPTPTSRFEYQGIALDRAEISNVERVVYPTGARLVRVTTRGGAVVTVPDTGDRERFLEWWALEPNN